MKILRLSKSTLLLLMLINPSYVRAKLSARLILEDYKDVELVRDDSTNSPEEILFFTGSQEIIPLQHSIIKALPHVNFTILGSKTNGITEKLYTNGLSQKKLNYRYISYPARLTDWTQDRILRLYDNKMNKMMPITVFSKHLRDNEYSPFELGSLDALIPYYDFSPHRDEYITKHVVDKSTAEIFGYHSRYKNWFVGKSWLLSYGDGGDRITTKNRLFVGKITLDRMIKQVKNKIDLEGIEPIQFLESLFKKEIIAIDADKEIDRYSFHIDVYLSAISDDKVFLSSPMLTIKQVFNTKILESIPTFVDKSYYEKKIKRFKVVKKQLENKGIKVIEVPMLLIKVKGQYNSTRIADVSFTNGFFDNMTFHSTNYEINNKQINHYISIAEKLFVSIAKKHGIKVILHTGAEKSLAFGGEVRCTSAVLKNKENID